MILFTPPAPPAVPSRRSCHGGFSLLELIIALALIIALVGALFGFFWDLLATRERMIEMTARRRAAAILIERLERDLTTSVVGDRAAGAGVAGDATSVSILTRSVPVRLAERGVDRGDVFTDLERSQYRFRSGAKAVEARRSLAAVGSGGSRGGGAFVPLGGEIAHVRFRYHDGEGWRDRFDSLQADRLPAAVEVAVWFDAVAGEGEEEEDWEPGWDRDRDRDGEDRDRDRDQDQDQDRDRDRGMGGVDEVLDVTPPDRVRVIVVPDGGGDAAGGGEEVAP